MKNLCILLFCKYFVYQCNCQISEEYYYGSVEGDNDTEVVQGKSDAGNVEDGKEEGDVKGDDTGEIKAVKTVDNDGGKSDKGDVNDANAVPEETKIKEENKEHKKEIQRNEDHKEEAKAERNVEVEQEKNEIVDEDFKGDAKAVAGEEKGGKEDKEESKHEENGENEEQDPSNVDGELGTDSPPPKVTTEKSSFTEFDMSQFLNITDKNYTIEELEDLTSQTWAALVNKTEDEADDEETGSDKVYNASREYWDNFVQNLKFSIEYLLGIGHVGTHDQKLKACYFIGVTYKNSITDIHKYSKLRYLYTNNLHYEIGYLVQEIITHYQVAVELYHLMVNKYGKHRMRYFAPATYMLYIYTNILDQCKTVTHLCNMLHELENKYKKHPKSVFQDYKVQQEFVAPNIDKSYSHQKHQEHMKKRRQKEMRKQKKKIFESGLFVSFRSTRRPPKGPFPLHYGWSIETW